jgi:UDP-N-acetylmuramyl pentapeptide phosphotransferase/UDP-N-acetylglucosamine-1-phosphate transferase
MGGIVLVSSAVGVMLFFALLAMILGQREVYSGVACGLIPLGIGVGLLIDARIQTKEIEERGLGAGSQPTSLMRE